MKPVAGHRLARVQRVNAKRPAHTVDVSYAPKPARREALIDLLLELLDPYVQSGRR